MLRGTRWFTAGRLAWGLAMVVAGSVVAAAAAPADGNGEVDTFFVDVEGPGFAQPGNECLFRAVPQGGTSPFTYQWEWPASGTSSLGHAIMPSGVSSVVVAVDVWDSTNQHGTGQITVQLDPSNEPCEI